MAITKAIYEHLITKTKYNKKCVEAEALKQDIAKRDIMLNEQKKIFEDKKEEWDKALHEQEAEIIKLKKKIVKYKKEK